MRWVRRALLAVLLLVALAGAWVVYTVRDRPSLDPYDDLLFSEAPPARDGLRVTFLGVATLLLSDGETTLMTDGFFSRPSIWRAFLTSIAPDEAVIEAALKRAGANQVAAVFVVHSHYDHAMDAPAVARRTGALVVGSESTANVARGAGLEEAQIRVVRPGEPMEFGRFRVTMIPSRHFPHGMAMGEITKPLVPPARAMDYLEGGSYSVLFEHEKGNLLVQGSAGWEDGALAGRRADVVFLGMAGLGTKDDEYRKSYWREVVEAVGARRVIPIHWDDFMLPLDDALVPMPRMSDDLDLTMRFLRERAAAARIELHLLQAFQPVDPLVGLP